MGMSSGGSPTNEINVTPLIDVLLVLLVIFLVAMPVVMRMETVDVPRKDDSVQPEAAIAITVHADLTVSIDDGPAMPANDLPRALQPQLAVSHVVFVAVEDGVPWREAVGTVDMLRSLDGVQVALRTRE